MPRRGRRRIFIRMADYLRTPPAGGGPGVLVLHPWWGLNGVIRAYCDRLAAEGFVALAPDFYGGAVVTTREEAQRLADGLDHAAAGRVVAAARERLAGLPSVRGSCVGTVGFSLGAFLALRLAAGAGEDLSAVVLYYGTGDGDFHRSKAAFLGHFAHEDEFEDATWVETFRSGLVAAGRPVIFHAYPGTRHWFAESDRPEYNAAAADLAFSRTVDFLRRHLAPTRGTES